MKYKIVAIEREYGSGGRDIARQVSEKLGIKLYGKEILLMAAEKSGMPAKQLEKIEESANDTVWDSISVMNKMILGDGTGLSDKNQLAKMEAEIILSISNKESCVFLGRGAGFLLGDRSDTLSVFVHADYDFRKDYAIEHYGIDETDADKMMKLIDKKRSNYYSSYRELMWGEKEGYDLMLNSGKLGIHRCVDLIVRAFNL